MALMFDQISLPVMEHFYTIQGEGYHQGKAAYFIRLAGCDVGCVWCDVKDSWNANDHPKYAIDEIVSWVKNSMSTGIVVITGGEPLMHQLGPLTKALKMAGFATHIETSGTHPISGDWDWICFSPKKFKNPLPEIYEVANELKAIVYHKSDLEWAQLHKAQLDATCKLYLQPEWSKQQEQLPLMVEFIKSFPEWTLCLQIHKYINVP